MGKKLLFVLNAHAGKGEIKNKLLAIVETFVAGGYEVTVHPTTGRGDALRLARDEAQRYDLIVCSGGDGTLNETVRGLMANPARPPLGYIPTGTVNDFARSLKLPRDMVQAAQLILDGQPFACDVGAFNQEHFVYIAAFGAFTEVSYQTPQHLKSMLGRVAYLLEGAMRIGEIQSYRLCMEHEGGRVEDNFMFGMVTNATSVGGFKGITQRNIHLNDGLFEVMLVKTPSSAMELQRIINALLRLEVDRELIHIFKTGRLSITADREMPWTLDGEFGGTPYHVDIQNCRRAVTVIRAKPAD